MIVTLEVDAGEVLVALRRGEDYEDVHPEIVAEDAKIHWPDYRVAWPIVEPSEDQP